MAQADHAFMRDQRATCVNALLHFKSADKPARNAQLNHEKMLGAWQTLFRTCQHGSKPRALVLTRHICVRSNPAATEFRSENVDARNTGAI